MVSDYKSDTTAYPQGLNRTKVVNCITATKVVDASEFGLRKYSIVKKKSD